MNVLHHTNQNHFLHWASSRWCLLKSHGHRHSHVCRVQNGTHWSLQNRYILNHHQQKFMLYWSTNLGIYGLLWCSMDHGRFVNSVQFFYWKQRFYIVAMQYEWRLYKVGNFPRTNASLLINTGTIKAKHFVSRIFQTTYSFG